MSELHHLGFPQGVITDLHHPYSNRAMEFPWHSGKVLEQLNRQRKEGLLCDCTFVVDGIDFKAHKAVLAACSAYFRTLFLDQKDVVHLDISNAAGGLFFPFLFVFFFRTDQPVAKHFLLFCLFVVAGLGQVLEFIYTAKLNLSPQNLEDVLTVANFLQMQEVVNACSAYQSVAAPSMSLLALDFGMGESILSEMCIYIFKEKYVSFHSSYRQTS